MPVTDASALTSVTASLLDPLDADDVPIELKIPLPSSNPSSEEEGETKEMSLVTHQDTVNTPFADAEVVPPQGPRTIPSEPTGDDRGEAPLAEAARPSPISLEDMAHLIDLERYQRVRTRSIQARLTRLSLSCGLDRRLISSCSIAYGNMIDQYKTDDQAGFGGLYEAYEQLKGTCDASRNAVDLPDMNAGKEFEPLDNTDNRSYIQLLPSDDQDTILRFLKRIRTEANFLSDRIHNLSPEELTGLTSLYHPAGIDFSVLPNHSHGKTQFYSRDSQMMKLSRRMDNLHRFHNQDPFFALLYSVFDSSARPGSQEYARRIDIWATACARNMVGGFLEAKPGSDELIIATIDSFTDFRDWAIKPRMETYLMRILVEGSFLLDSPLNQPKVFKESIETYNAKAVVAEVEFFEKALTDLFGLLAIEPNHQAVPEGALLFVHAILRKIKDPKLRHRAKVFIVCRWYFATLMSSIVVYPEVSLFLYTARQA